MAQDNVIVSVVSIGAILVFILFALRFLFGGSEDSWICANGEWLRHGNPTISKPVEPCN
ncbi:MAG: hypothetical protein WC775_01785 [Patescibacteria group bacterium]|jgi:hypothetical protein